MRQENRDLAGQVGYLQARVQIHEETIRALTAPETQEATQPAPVPPAVTSEPSTPWWRRWWPLVLFVVIGLAAVLAVTTPGVVR